jgi:putative membrane-bound dehydrogenase-like protein
MMHRVALCPTWFRLVSVAVLVVGRADGDEPRVLVDGLRLELVAEQPEIVTPIGMTFDRQGRLLVIESHTHFRTETYDGPPADRIRIVDQLDSGKPRFRTFFEGTVHTMSLETHPNGWIYVATRNRIFRLRDDDGDGTADREEPLARLETAGNYPHNGLCGLTFDAAGNVYFGLGENLGEPYELIGADGTKLAGGGEGGNIYRLDAEGRGLTRIATGFWNPFGMCFDQAGRLFEVGNDPGGCPPCRLVHVVPAGDYGFQYRYGRTGRHPLQAWNGELPGTLPMVAGTGEAPCDVKPIRGSLWVTSWGHNRIERFLLQPAGASWKATSQILVLGDGRFRPVDFAVAPDGSVYFSDWVDVSYEVHRQGRIWRLRFDSPELLRESQPALTPTELQADTLRSMPSLDALGDADPFLRQAAIGGFAAMPTLPDVSWSDLSPLQRVSWLQALRWRKEAVPDEVVAAALGDPRPDVRLSAVRIVADEKRAQHRRRLEQMLPQAVESPPLLAGVLAAISHLEEGTTDNKTEARIAARVSALLWSAVEDSSLPAAARASALQRLSRDDAARRQAEIAKLALNDQGELGAAALWRLIDSPRDDHLRIFGDVATNEALPAGRRAVAVMGLSAGREQFADLLGKLKGSSEASIRTEATRALVPDLKQRRDERRPASANVDDWLAVLTDEGDAEAGERLFFNPAGPSCSRCHSHSGRGASVGPELTTIGRQLDRGRLLTALLDPSRDIAPQYRTEVFVTSDGLVVTGMIAAYRNLSNDEEPDRERREELTVVGADGNAVAIRTGDIVQRRESATSIMPAGLHELLTLQELRDLLAFLEESR